MSDPKVNMTSQKLAEFNNWKAQNSDGYGRPVVDTVETVMRALDAGASPEQAYQTMLGRPLSGSQANMACGSIVHFHVRGTEFAEYFRGPKDRGTK